MFHVMLGNAQGSEQLYKTVGRVTSLDAGSASTGNQTDRWLGILTTS